MAKLSPTMKAALKAIEREGGTIYSQSCDGSGTAWADKSKIAIREQTLRALCDRGLLAAEITSKSQYRSYRGRRTHYCSETLWRLKV